MDNTNMAQGLSFAEDMKRLEELKKQFEMTQSPDFSLPELEAPSMQITPEDLRGMSSNSNASQPQAMDRDAILQDYRDKLIQRIQGSEGRLEKAETSFKESQEAGGGWKGGIAKGLGILGDTFSAMGGGQGGHTKNIMGQFAGDKKAGAEAYKTALEKEKGILGEIEKTDKSSMEAAKMKDFIQSRDPKSEESKAARLFAEEAYKLPKLPDAMNAIQVKVYLDQYAKKHNLASAEKWRQKNYEQRERAMQGPTPKELEKREYEEKTKPPTEGQATSAIHTRAMLEGEESAKAQLKKGYDPTEWTSQVGETLQKTPFIGPIARQFRSNEGVAYTDAKDSWIGAKLRKESGAAINADEYLKENRKYFPQSGDTAETSARKEKARKALTEQMAKNAGKALTPEQVAEVDKIYKIPDIKVPPMDAEALDWLKKNPNHPDAAAVAKKLGLSN
jgi:hypothetical protein